MNNPTVAEIRLLGERIPLKTTDSDHEFVAEVIELVSARLESAEERMKGVKHPHQVALLALLDIAEEYIRARRRTADYQSELAARAQKVLQELEGA